MATNSNPLVGAAWGGQPQSPLGVTNPLQLPQSAEPTNSTNPFNISDPMTTKNIQRSLSLSNLQTGEDRNALIPQFAQLFGQYGGDAAGFFKQLMNLGSPYYQQKQSEGFTQGVNQNQNASAEARQKLNAQGYGSTPSGANAAMIGGMEMQGSNNLAEQYLQNLFQNEAMQVQGGTGLASMAQMFDPSKLTQQSSPTTPMQSPSLAEQFSQIVGSLSGAGYSTPSGGGATL